MSLCTLRTEPEHSVFSALLPAPKRSFSSWDREGPVAGVSSRDEQGLPALRMTSYFLPGLCCPEQIGFALFFCLGNMSSPIPV